MKASALHVQGKLSDTVLGLDFTVGRLLGKGGFGQVVAATDTREGRGFAIKALRKTALQDEWRSDAVQREIAIQQFCRHDNVVALHSTFFDDSFVYLLLEYCGRGTVRDLLRARGALTEPEVRILIGQAASALQFLHDEHGILHRDLTAANLLIASDMTLKVADFGFARQADDIELLTTRWIEGTLHYQPPEVIQFTAYSKATDMWSLGCVLVFMLMGRHPFDSAAPNEQLCGAITSFSAPALPPSISCAATELAYRLMRPNSGQRLRAAAVLRHAFITDRRAEVVQLTPNHLTHKPHRWEVLLVGRLPSPTPTTAAERSCGGSPADLGAGASSLNVPHGPPTADFPLALLTWCKRAIAYALTRGGAKDCVEMTSVIETADEAACRVRKWSSTFGERPHGVLRGDGALTAIFPDKSTLTISGDRAIYAYTERGALTRYWATDEAPTNMLMMDKRNELARLRMALLDGMPPIGRRWTMFGERTATTQRARLCLLQSLPTGAAVCTFDDSSVQALLPDSHAYFHMKPSDDGRDLCVTATTVDAREWRLALPQRAEPLADVVTMTAELQSAFADLHDALLTVPP